MSTVSSTSSSSSSSSSASDGLLHATNKAGARTITEFFYDADAIVSENPDAPVDPLLGLLRKVADVEAEGLVKDEVLHEYHANHGAAQAVGNLRRRVRKEDVFVTSREADANLNFEDSIEDIPDYVLVFLNTDDEDNRRKIAGEDNVKKLLEDRELWTVAGVDSRRGKLGHKHHDVEIGEHEAMRLYDANRRRAVANMRRVGLLVRQELSRDKKRVLVTVWAPQDVLSTFADRRGLQV